jgi:hypothetical protein
MLIFPQTRGRNFMELRDKIENDMAVKWFPDRRVTNQTVLVNQLITTRESLDAHDMATGNFWLSVSRLLPISQTPFSPDQLSSGRFTQVLPELDRTDVVSNISSSPPSSGLFNQSTIDNPEARWSTMSSKISIGPSLRHPSTVMTDYSYIRETSDFPPFDTTLSQPPTVRQYPLARKMFRQKNYFASGISPDCGRVFFLGEGLADVFEIPREMWNSTSKEPILRLRAPKNELFRSASLGTSTLAVISGSCCSLYTINGAVSPQQICSPIQLSHWDPECVTLGALDSRSIVAIGWRCGMAGTNETRGKLTIYEILQQDGKIQLPVLISIPLPERDYPKFVSLSQDSRGLFAISCTTQRLNIVSAWRLCLHPPSAELLCSTARSFTAVRILLSQQKTLSSTDTITGSRCRRSDINSHLPITSWASIHPMHHITQL